MSSFRLLSTSCRLCCGRGECTVCIRKRNITDTKSSGSCRVYVRRAGESQEVGGTCLFYRVQRGQLVCLFSKERSAAKSWIGIISPARLASTTLIMESQDILRSHKRCKFERLRLLS